MLTGRQAGRFYLHGGGISIYGHDCRRKAKELWGMALEQLETQRSIAPYVLGVFFAYRGEAVLDLFVPLFENISLKWQESPLVQAFQYHNFEFTKHPGIFPCADTFSVLAKEEEYRRKTRTLEHYLTEAPCLHLDIVRMSF